MIETAKKFMAEMQKIDPTAQVLMVGGCVRDIIMGKEPNDIDIATNIPVEVIDQHFNSHDIGRNKDFGLTVVVFEGVEFEVANYRTEGTYTDGRHPDEVKIVNTFEEDSKRRDFTFNAFGMDINGTIIDYHNGQEDIENKVLRTVGDPSERFAEDYIRIMRAIRFSAKFGFKMASEVETAIKENAHKITTCVSPERIWNEMTKMASGKNFHKAVEMMFDLGVMEHVFPELDVMKNFFHSPNHHPEGAKVWVE